ncbi:MAG: radical SAM protein, partial [Mediterranea sp.]|nr:radical SAM protein [Mediterranea sp.]
MIDSNKTYILNPDYILLGDVNRIVLTYKNHNSTVETITSFIHPMHALLLSLFDGRKNLGEILDTAITLYDISKEEALSLVSLFIENEEQVSLLYDGIKFGFPQYVLVNNRNNIIRDDINYSSLAVTQPYDFQSKRLNKVRRLLFVLNMQCKTDCIYCYADRATKHTCMPLQKVLDLIDEMKAYGIIGVDISGGDIFAYKDWYPVLKKLYSLGYDPYISTKIPITKQDIDKLR